MYKTLKMPAHWCIYKLLLYIHFIKYLFYISEYKAMLIQLFIYITVFCCCFLVFYFCTALWATMVVLFCPIEINGKKNNNKKITKRISVLRISVLKEPLKNRINKQYR